MIGFGTIAKLKELLTDDNLKYLKKILTMLTDSKSPVYNSFWLEFQQEYPGQTNFENAWSGLKQLRKVVLSQLGER